MKKIILLWITTVIFMSGIFYFSSKPASISSKQSGAVTKIVNRAVNSLPIKSDVKKSIMKKTETYVRKSAHLAEYFILGILVLSACLATFKKKNFWIALIICLLYAVSDEIHQLFVPGRTSRIFDVFIDGCGVLAGEFAFIYLRYLLFFRKGVNTNEGKCLERSQEN